MKDKQRVSVLIWNVEHPPALCFLGQIDVEEQIPHLRKQTLRHYVCLDEELHRCLFSQIFIVTHIDDEVVTRMYGIAKLIAS